MSRSHLQRATLPKSLKASSVRRLSENWGHRLVIQHSHIAVPVWHQRDSRTRPPLACVDRSIRIPATLHPLAEIVVHPLTGISRSTSLPMSKGKPLLHLKTAGNVSCHAGRRTPPSEPLPMRRGVCETVLLLAVAAWLGAQLFRAGFFLEALGVVILAAAGAFAETRAAGAPFLQSFSQRPGATAGVNIGVLALPVLYGAKLLVDGGRGWNGLAFWITISSGAGAVTSILHTRAQLEKGRRYLGPVSVSMLCCAFCGAASTGLPGVTGVVQESTLIALLAAASQYMWQAMMSQFPSSFTAGEALLAAQGCTLLVGSVALRTFVWFTSGGQSVGGVAEWGSQLHSGWPKSAAQAGLPKHALSLELDAVGCIIQALLTSLLIVATAYSALKPALARPSRARRPDERPPSVSKATLDPSGRPKAPGTEQNIENGLNGVKHLQGDPADVNGANGATDSDYSSKEELIHTAIGTHQRTTAAVRRESFPAIRENPQQNEIETSPSKRQVVAFYTLLAVAITAVAPLWLCTVGQLPQHPLVWIVQFLEQAPVARVGFCSYWLVLLLGTLLLIPRLGATPTILVRKAYHLLAVAMFAPALLHQPVFLRLAFGGALVCFVLLETVRLHRIPPLAAPVDTFLHRFTDARDSGPLVVSHFSLLLGCALPLWLAPALPGPSLASFAGVLSIGLGDTMASLVGVKYGRTHLCADSKKTVEGTIAGFLSMLAGLLVLQWGFEGGRLEVYYVAATLIASLLEAFTVQSDNVFVPILYAALLMLHSEV